MLRSVVALLMVLFPSAMLFSMEQGNAPVATAEKTIEPATTQTAATQTTDATAAQAPAAPVKQVPTAKEPTAKEAAAKSVEGTATAQSAPIVQADEPAPPQPIALFQNVTLNDFDYFLDDGAKKEDTFALSPDGVLRISGKPLGWIGTKKEYKNFTLALDYRWPEGDEPSNSGLFIRLNGNSEMHLPRAVEIQLQHSFAGDLLVYGGMKIFGEKERYLENLNHRTGEFRSVKKFHHVETPNFEKKPGEWNTLLIHCFEGMLVVRLNGHIVNWANCLEAIPGKIAFQSEGGPIEFRNAILTEEK